MKIHLPAYPEGVHRILAALEPVELELNSEVFSTLIHLELFLDRHDPYLQFEFHLQTEVALECDRCLAPFTSLLTVRAPMLYVIGRAPSPLKQDDPEIGYLPAGAVDVDLTTDLRDFLILALPGKKLCSDDCKGLCPRCGADLNTQPCSCRVE